MKLFKHELIERLNELKFNGVRVNDDLTVTIDNKTIVDYDKKVNRFYINVLTGRPISNYNDYKKLKVEIEEYIQLVDDFNSYIEKNEIVIVEPTFEVKRVRKFVDNYEKNIVVNDSELALYFYNRIVNNNKAVKKYLSL